MDYKGLTIQFDGDASKLLAVMRKIDSEASATQTALGRISAALKLDPTNKNLYRAQSRLLSQSLADEEKHLAGLRSEYERCTRGGDEYKDKVAELSDEIAISEAKVKGYKEELEATSRMSFFRTNPFGQWIDSTEKFGQSLYKVGSYLNNVIGLRLTMMEGVLALGFGRSVLDEVEDYTNAISQVGGYLDITGDKLEDMSELALYWGKETQFSATEAANAMSELAKGGMTDAQIKAGALEATMQLAAAGGISMADAATVAVNAIKVFGLNAEDATDVADALAGAANKSTAEIGDLASSFRYVSGWAGLADYSINDVSGALGLLADYGLTGQIAGTGLRNVLQRLAAPTGKAASLMEEYGLQVYNADGKMKGIVDIVNDLNRAFSGLDDETRNGVLNTIFGARGLPAAVALMEAGGAELENYISATEKEGYALEMMQARMGDIGWALEYLRGEFETFKVSIGKAMEPFIIEVAEALESMLATFNAWPVSKQRAFVTNMIRAAAVAPGILALGTALKIVGGSAITLSRVSAAVAEFLPALAKGRSTFESASAAVSALTGNMMDNAAAASLLKTSFGMLAGAAALFVGIKVAEGLYNVYRHGREMNRMLERSGTLFQDLGRKTRGSSGDVDNFTDKLYGVQESASDAAENIWELIDRVNDFYDSISETNRELSTNSQMLDEAARLISQFGGDAEISEEDQRNLAAALSFLNEQLGTNYTLHRDTGGVIYDENGQVVTLKDSIYDLIEAQKELARVNAYTEMLEEGYKNQAEAAAKVKEAEEQLAQAEADRDEALARYGSRRNAQYYEERAYWDQQINGANGYKAQLEAARATEEATAQTVAQLEQQLGEATLAAEEASSKTVNAVKELGDTVPGLREKLVEAGVSVSDFTGLTKDEFNQMVEESGDDLDTLLQKLQEWIDKHPDEKKFPTEAEEAAQKVAELEEQVNSYSRKLQEERANLSTPIRGVVELETDTDGNGTLSEALNTMGRISGLRGLGKHAGTAQVSGTIWEFMEKLLPDWKQTNLGTKNGKANVSGNLHQSTNDLKEWNRLGMDSKWGKATIALAIQGKGIKQRDGGINYYRHADGYITNHSIYSTGHLIGEAGIEAVLPLNNRAATRPLTDTIADGVARRVAGATQYNLYINDARVNDDPAIRSAFIGLMTTLERKGAMNVGNR